mmetsp:Transcript_47974/g.104375  ORF Transcript_47974/g.104375 Transcript_47974/m.104375 type:complete len:212 (+) Transcript_47974:1527-2162(+)
MSNEASGDADALDQPSTSCLSVRHRVGDVGRAEADDASTAAKALIEGVENLVPARAVRRPVPSSRTAWRLCQKGNCLRHPARQVEHVGSGIRALHVVRSPHDLSKGLLEQGYPKFIGICRVCTEELAISPHRHAIVDDHLPSSTVQKKPATVLPILVVSRLLLFLLNPRMENPTQHRFVEEPLVLCQGRQRREKRAVANEALADATRCWWS